MKRYLAEAPDRKHHGLWSRDMDPKTLAAHHKFVEEMELSVAVANREVIQKHVPNLNRATFQQIAVMVARFRAEYLEAAVRLANSDGCRDGACLVDLKRKRELYDQGCAAFEALERAIERGYVDLDPAD